MQMNLSSMDQFNTSVVTSVSKKSLELQYRSLFVLQDILKTNIESNNTTKEALEKIRHNTSLPDYLKFKNSEFRAMIFKQTIAQNLYGSMLGKGKDMFKVLIDSTNTFVGNKWAFSSASRSTTQSPKAVPGRARLLPLGQKMPYGKF